MIERSLGQNGPMSDHDVSTEELEEQNGELLPDREALSVIDPLGGPQGVPLEGGSEPAVPPPHDDPGPPPTA